MVSAAAFVQPDIMLLDSIGKAVRDTKAERIAEDTALLNLIAPKMAHSETLRAMANSYSQAVTDSSNELVHLYEVRDALSKYYGGEHKARDVLNISEAEWDRLGRLANVEPLLQGRHRGKHPASLRPATAAELAEARDVAKRWIIAFARAV